MLHYPDVMRKAQAELDKIVGPDRLPTFEDHSSLRYVNALINETLRWRPIAVLGGTPHSVTADDEYNGMWVLFLNCTPSSILLIVVLKCQVYS